MANHFGFQSFKTPAPRTVEGTITWDLPADVQKDCTVPQRIHTLDAAVAGAPILGFQSRIAGPRAVKNVVFYLLRTRRFRDYVQATTTFTATTADIPIADADKELIQVGAHIINLNTREVMRVTGKASAGIVNVERHVGTIGGTANSTTTDTFMLLGYFGAEGDSKFFGLSKFPDVMFQYCGEIQDCYSITQWAVGGKMMPGAETPQAKERREHLENTRMTLEKQAIMSQRAKGPRASDGKTVYAPQGLDGFCTENEKDFGGGMGQALLEEWGEDLGRYGPEARFAMCSPKFLRMVNLTLLPQQRQDKEVLKRAGLRVITYESGGVTFHFWKHPLFYDDPSAATDALNGHCYVYPPDDLRFGTLNSSLTGWFKWRMNVETPGDRLKQDQLYVNWTLIMTHPELYGRGYNPGAPS